MSALTREQREILRQNFFLQSEINAFANAKTVDKKHYQNIDLNSNAWKSMMRSRKNWALDRFKQGWDKEQIKREINNYYKPTKNTPWDFLQAEYGLGSTGKATDFDIRRRIEKKKKIRVTLGQAKKKSLFKKHLPKFKR
jgi:hypothetical protein